MINLVLDLLCKGIEYGITSSVTNHRITNINNYRSEFHSDNTIDTQTDKKLEGDWSYLFMPEPIAGGTKHVEKMYKN